MRIKNTLYNHYKNIVKKIFLINHLKLLKNKYHNSPIPLDKILKMRSVYGIIIPDQDPIFPPFDMLQSKGSSIGVDELKNILHEATLGEWALEKNTIELIWQKLIAEKPQIIVECGAGISTIVLSKYASTYSSLSSNILIISIEQDLKIKKDLENKLLKLGLSNNVFIIYAPYHENYAYNINWNQNEILKRIEYKVDWLLIDGPSGVIGCRSGTISLLSKLCKPNARWLLDDALRDGELNILVKWSQIPGVTVEGIYPVGKGLATGLLNTRMD